MDLPLPRKNTVWRRWPLLKPDFSKKFCPRPENQPVGSRLPFRETFVETWGDLYLDVLAQIAAFTNECGAVKMGAFWHHVDCVDMLKFQCALMRMAHIRRNKLVDYFSCSEGDPVIRELSLSFKRFSAIYRNLRMFSEANVKASGANN